MKTQGFKSASLISHARLLYAPSFVTIVTENLKRTETNTNAFYLIIILLIQNP